MGKESRNNPLSQFVGSANRQGIYDKLGRPVPPGSTVAMLSAYHDLWMVAEVTPNLDPQAPAGSVVVTFRTQLIVNLPAATPLPDLILVAHPPTATDLDEQQAARERAAEAEAPQAGPKLVIP